MSIKVHLYSSLRKYADNREIIEVDGTTVRECLEDLIRQFPSISPVLFDEAGKPREKVFVSINLESAYREKMTTPIKENDDLYLILIVAGG
ncbi:MAG: MoaD/ThiS family protein [Acidobacteria bacterium]|nr:MoaD/ThiS family protein [Acidobacteriota bacterium]